MEFIPPWNAVFYIVLVLVPLFSFLARAEGLFCFAGGPQRANSDTERYRTGYPDKPDNPEADLNYRFYMGRMLLPGHSVDIDDIHTTWFGDWERLERQHDYIQWLFPIRELSMFNSRSQELQLHEAQRIKENPEARARVLRSYEMMLDFYGMQLMDASTGEVARHARYRWCYENLNYSAHNSLRITRILKSLGELGLEHYKKPFVMHVLREIYEHGELVRTKSSCAHYWAAVLRSDDELEEVQNYIRGREKEC